MVYVLNCQTRSQVKTSIHFKRTASQIIKRRLKPPSLTTFWRWNWGGCSFFFYSSQRWFFVFTTECNTRVCSVVCFLYFLECVDIKHTGEMIQLRFIKMAAPSGPSERRWSGVSESPFNSFSLILASNTWTSREPHTHTHIPLLFSRSHTRSLMNKTWGFLIFTQRCSLISI